MRFLLPVDAPHEHSLVRGHVPRADLQPIWHAAQLPVVVLEAGRLFAPVGLHAQRPRFGLHVGQRLLDPLDGSSNCDAVVLGAEDRDDDHLMRSGVRR